MSRALAAARSPMLAVLGLALVLTGLQVATSAPASANPAGTHLVINEVSGGNGTGAGATDEFIELYNPTSATITFTGTVQYKSATGTTFTAISPVTTFVVAPHGYWLVAGTNYSGTGTPDSRYPFDMSASPTSGGHVALTGATTAVTTPSNDPLRVDLVAWGTGNTPEGTAAPSHPASGGSLRRTNGIDTDNNSVDFKQAAVRSPRGSAQNAALTIANPGTKRFTVDTAITPVDLHASGGLAPYTYAVSSGSLPDGITLDPSTGQVSGTPNATSPAADVTVRATDANGDPAAVTFSISVTEPLGPVVVANPGSQTFTVGTPVTPFSLASSGGAAPYTYAVTGGALPAGITLDPATGEVSGTPTAATAASDVTVTATDAEANTGSVTFSIAVAARPAGTATWTGASSALWSDPDNWVGVTPVAGDDLVFPAGASRTTVVNDLAAGTSFRSLTLAGAGYTVSGNALTLTGSLAATYSSGATTSSIDLTLEAGAVTVAAGGRLSLTGVVAGAAGLTFGGGGTLALDATSNTYTGGTTVGPGLLEVNGAIVGSVVLDGGTLGGTGTLNGAGLTATSPSVVSPGGKNAPGKLTYGATTGLALPSTSTYRVDLDSNQVGVGYDQLRLTSGSALFNPNNARLEVDLGYVPAVNTSFQIVSQAFGSPITGRFNGLSQFGSFTSGPATFSIGYFNSGIILTVVAVNVTTFTWDGGGSTSNWSDAANWAGDAVPYPGAALVFADGVDDLTPVNDLAAGFDVTSLTIARPGYQLSGAAIDLAGAVSASYPYGTSTVDLGLRLSSEQQTVQVDEGGTLVIDAPISGSGGLTRTGPGTVRIIGTSHSFTGATHVDRGTLVVDGSIASSSRVQVGGLATLTGTGALPAVSVGGRLEPDTLSTGDLNLGSGSELRVGLTDGDTVDVNGTVQLESPAQLTVLPEGAELGDVFTIVDNDGSDAVVGTFAGLPEGTTFVRDDAILRISYVGGSGNDIVLTVVLLPTETEIVSSTPTAVTGQSVTFIGHAADVVYARPAQGGTIRFLVNGIEAQAAAEVDQFGSVYFTTVLPVGDTTVTAEYVGAGYTGSSALLVQTVVAAATTTTLDAPAGPVDAGDPLDLTAAVLPTAPGGGTPAGTVRFYDGATLLGTATLDGEGLATLATSDLSAGSHALTASYEGGTDYLASTSAEVESTVVKRTTAVTVTTTAPTAYGAPVTFTATATVDGAAVTGGTIRFLVAGSEVQADVVVDAAGRASFTTSSLPVGDTTVIAEYAGTPTLAGASGAWTHTVERAATTTTVQVTGTSVIATVSPAASGVVSFTANGTPLGTAPLVGGVATLATSLAAGRPVEVVATYLGSTTHVGSTGFVLRADPSITTRVTSSALPRSGWYRAPVRVTFTCVAGSAALTEPCPAAVVLRGSGRGKLAQRTITGADGGSVTTVVKVNIDRVAPRLRVKRIGNRLHCRARDPLSGVAACRIRSTSHADGVITWVAKARDRAGNVTTRRGHFRME